MLRRLRELGPAVWVTAAFIGPGTVTVCSIAGYRYGYALLWALLFSVLATIVLQEMAARLGIVSRLGLSEALRSQIRHPIFRVVALALVFSAILIGNSAYEAGNISGGVLGMEALWGPLRFSLMGRALNVWSLLLGFLASLLLWRGNYHLLERALMVLVGVMSVVFVLTAMFSWHLLAVSLGSYALAFRQILTGLLFPEIPTGSWLTILGLIGTTIVPYNLFLHASSAAQKWTGEKALQAARWDTLLAIALGGVVSMAIVVSSAALQGQAGEIRTAVDLALQLEPLLGKSAKYFLSLGLFAAGLSSAITAPLAAAWVATGIWPGDKKGQNNEMQRSLFRSVALLVLLIGVIFSGLGYKPIQIIRFAQAANGLLLPFIAVFLLWLMNRYQLLGTYTNSRVQNMLGILVVLLTGALGIKMIWTLL